MEKETFEGLRLFYKIYDSVDALVNENEKLKEENKYLKERVEWLEKNLRENYIVAQESISKVLKGCLDGRIKIEDNKTTIQRK